MSAIVNRLIRSLQSQMAQRTKAGHEYLSIDDYHLNADGVMVPASHSVSTTTSATTTTAAPAKDG